SRGGIRSPVPRRRGAWDVERCRNIRRRDRGDQRKDGLVLDSPWHAAPGAAVRKGRWTMTKLLSRLVVAGLFLLVAVSAMSAAPPSIHHVGRMVDATQFGACGCAKGLICCLDCNGGTLCVRYKFQCPECPAP